MNTFLAFYQNLGPALTLLVIGTFLLAGTVKGVIGLGLPTVAMGMLGLAMLPAQAAALLIIPSTVTNLWQLAFGGHLSALLKRLWPMLLLIFLGTGLGTVWLGMDGGQWVVRALGAALLVYALSGLFLPTFKVKARTERWVGPLCGLAQSMPRCWPWCRRCWACGWAKCCASASVRSCSSGYFLSAWHCWAGIC
jgi:hypothetical protein